jgi:hypothetical protein
MTGVGRRARFAAAALAAASLGGPATAVEGFPGSTWGDLYWEVPRPGDDDTILEGWIRQGVAWRRWKAGQASFTLQSYGTLRYKWDSLAQGWNSYLGPGAGVALDFAAPGLPLVSAGIEYVHQWNYRSTGPAPYTAPFLDWYHWWDLRADSWPGSTWGALRWEIPNSGPGNLFLQGWVRQGAVVARWKPEPVSLVLAPYLRVHYKIDTLGLAWNNAVGPGAGIALDMEGVTGLQLSWGVEYGWEKNLWATGGVHRLDLVMRWYAWWDLGRR